MIEEIVLIKADNTALQAKFVLPSDPKNYIIVLHAPKGSRHDKAVKSVEKLLENSTTASLLADLTDDNEGGVADEKFLLSRTHTIIDWFLKRTGAQKIALYAIDPSELFVQTLLAHNNIESVYVENEGGLWLYKESESLKKVSKEVNFLK